MKRLPIIFLASVLISGHINAANAIEYGEDATGSGFVVPIAVDKGNGQTGGCSGALIAPSIVVTAGHCVLDSNGLLTKNVYVGQSGSSQGSITLNDKISSVQITSTFQDGPGATVGDDDLAFLTLSKPQSLKVAIVLASEKQTADMKSAQSALKTFGYGRYGDTSNEVVTFPKSMSGTFSNVSTKYSNSAYLATNKSNACMGDSGSPVLNITANQVTLVGILTGVTKSVNCSAKDSDGIYRSLFTLVGRYANLAFSAATDVMNDQDRTISSSISQVTKANSDLNGLRVELALAKSALDTAKQDLEDLQGQLDEANALIETLKKKLPQSIVCVKGKLTQKVTGITPKCPKGFSLKA